MSPAVPPPPPTSTPGATGMPPRPPSGNGPPQPPPQGGPPGPGAPAGYPQQQQQQPGGGPPNMGPPPHMMYGKMGGQQMPPYGGQPNPNYPGGGQYGPNRMGAPGYGPGPNNYYGGQRPPGPGQYPGYNSGHYPPQGGWGGPPPPGQGGAPQQNMGPGGPPPPGGPTGAAPQKGGAPPRQGAPGSYPQRPPHPHMKPGGYPPGPPNSYNGPPSYNGPGMPPPNMNGPPGSYPNYPNSNAPGQPPMNNYGGPMGVPPMNSHPPSSTPNSSASPSPGQNSSGGAPSSVPPPNGPDGVPVHDETSQQSTLSQSSDRSDGRQTPKQGPPGSAPNPYMGGFPHPGPPGSPHSSAPSPGGHENNYGRDMGSPNWQQQPHARTAPSPAGGQMFGPGGSMAPSPSSSSSSVPGGAPPGMPDAAAPAPPTPTTPYKAKTSKAADSLTRLYEMDDNPDRRLFLDRLFSFMEEQGKPITACPTISKNPLDLYKLYVLTKERGGFMEVNKKCTKNKTWKDIAALLGIGASSSGAYTLKKHYGKNLLYFECHFDRGGIDPAPLLAQVEAGTKKKAKAAAAAAAANPPPAPSPGSQDSRDSTSFGSGGPGGSTPNSAMPGEYPHPGGYNNAAGAAPGYPHPPGGPGGDAAARPPGPHQAGYPPHPNSGYGGQYPPPRPGGPDQQQYPPGSYPNNYPAPPSSTAGGPPPRPGWPPQGAPGYMGPPPHHPNGTSGPHPPSSAPAGGPAPGWNQQAPNYSGPRPGYPPSGQPGPYPGSAPYGDQYQPKPGGPPAPMSGPPGAPQQPPTSKPPGAPQSHPAPAVGPGGPPPPVGPPGGPPFTPPGPPNSVPHPPPGAKGPPPPMGPPMSTRAPSPQGYNQNNGPPNTTASGTPHSYPPAAAKPGSTPPGAPGAPGSGPRPGGPPQGYPGYGGQQQRPPMYQGNQPWQQNRYPGPGSQGSWGPNAPGGMNGPRQPGPWGSSGPPTTSSGSWGPHMGQPGQPRPQYRPEMGRGPMSSHQRPGPAGPAALSGPIGRVAFPPGCVESTPPLMMKRRKHTKVDVQPVDGWRLIMALKSGLLMESTWALDVLNVLLFDDNAFTFFGLGNMPGLMESVLEHWRASLIDMFGITEELEAQSELGAKVNDTRSRKRALREEREKGKKWYDLKTTEALEDAENLSCTTELELGVVGKKRPSVRDRCSVLRVGAQDFTKRPRFSEEEVEIEDKDEALFVTDEDRAWDTEKGGFQLTSDMWENGGGNTTAHFLTHIEGDLGLVPFVRLLKEIAPKSNSSPSKAGRSRKGGQSKGRRRSSPSKRSSGANEQVVVNGIKAKEEVVEENGTADIKSEIEENGEPMEIKTEAGEENGETAASEESELPPEDIIDRITRLTGIVLRDPETARKRWTEENLEEECYMRDEPALHLVTESQNSIGKRAVCVSTILRNLSFVPGNECEFSRNATFLSICGRLLLLFHYYPERSSKQRIYERDEEEVTAESCTTLNTDTEWWWDYLHVIRENMLVILANISGALELSRFDERITLPILHGLLEWAVSSSSYAQDPFPYVGPNSNVSPQRLAIETLCKLCLHESNVDLILATPPYTRIKKLTKLLAKKLYRYEDQVLREFSINMLYYLSAADTGVARTIATADQTVGLLLGFIEQAEQNAMVVAQQHGVNALRDNPDSMGTSLDMLRRAASTLNNLSRHPDNIPLFVRHEQRFLSLVMSQILDQGVAAILSNVLYNIGDEQGKEAVAAEFRKKQLELEEKLSKEEKKTSEVKKEGGDEAQEDSKSDAAVTEKGKKVDDEKKKNVDEEEKENVEKKESSES